MVRAGEKAQLYLNDTLVGDVVCQSANGGWGYGQFTPSESFQAFAALFGQWSLLMHADKDALSEAASEGLREVETQMDQLRVKLFFPARNQWRAAVQVGIDGRLVEWKEY